MPGKGAGDMQDESLYQVLGIQPNARAADIRAAYLRLARLHHPDRWGGGCEDAKQRFQRIVEAYTVLIDARRRQHYDLRLLHTLDVEDYLARYPRMILKVSGLDMAPPKPHSVLPRPGSEQRNLHLMSTAY